VRVRQLSISTLDTICWIARLGSFTAAAERLHTTQPAISQRVREFETNIGVRIFLRQGRGVELTIEGRELVRKAEPLLEQLEDLAISMQPDGAAYGLIRLGIGNISMSWFPQLVEKLRTLMPNLKFEVDVDHGGMLLEKLDARKLDIVVVAGPVDTEKFAGVSLGYDRMLWVTSPTALTKAGTADLTELFKAMPVWCVPRASFYTRIAISHLAKFGVDPYKIDVMNNMAAQMEMIVQGGGIGLLSHTLIKRALNDGTLIALPDEAQPTEPVHFSVAYAKEDPHRAVLQIVEQALLMSDLDRPNGEGRMG